MKSVIRCQFGLACAFFFLVNVREYALLIRAAVFSPKHRLLLCSLCGFWSAGQSCLCTLFTMQEKVVTCLWRLLSEGHLGPVKIWKGRRHMCVTECRKWTLFLGKHLESWYWYLCFRSRSAPTFQWCMKSSSVTSWFTSYRNCTWFNSFCHDFYLKILSSLPWQICAITKQYAGNNA